MRDAEVVFVGPAGNGRRVKLVSNALFVAQVGLAIDAVRLAGSRARWESRNDRSWLPYGMAAAPAAPSAS
ncbi:hypothetical protein [Streptomyces sp. NPDC002088]|uniref:hypothetical protein n=1 Tax=Streptomyces sp. NPDC002088 TaxID=3154665 RepID=UPI00332A6C18